FKAPRMVFESLCFVILPLIGPVMIVAYLVGAYQPRPGVVDGIYFPDGGFLFDLHVMWQAGHDVVTLHSPYPFVYPAPAALLLATRRFRTAAMTVACSAVVTLGSWAIFGFKGLLDYPHRLSRVAGLEQDKSYSPFALFRALDLSLGSARLAVLALTALLALAIVVVARREDGDRRSFVLAVVAALAVSPIVWLHYLVLLYVPLALYRPRFAPAWAIPI